MEEAGKKNRIKWVDLAKGLGIILVIIGHCVYLGHFVHNWIFSFHMPLFFILSGLFFKKDDPVHLIRKKYRQLIVPFIVFCAIGTAFTLVIPECRKVSLEEILGDIYSGYPNSINVSSIWFLVCLFIVYILFNEIAVLSEKSKILAYGLLVMIVLFGFALGKAPELLSGLPRGRLPMSIDCACVAILFFAVGYMFKRHIFDGIKAIETRSIFFHLVCIAFALIISVAVTFANGTVNLKSLIYNNEILYIIGSISGFSFIALVSTLMIRTNAVVSPVRWFGENSLKIMGVQAIVVRLYVLLLSKLIGRNFYLYYLPPVYSAIGCVAVTAVSGMMVTLFNHIKQKVTNDSKST